MGKQIIGGNIHLEKKGFKDIYLKENLTKTSRGGNQLRQLIFENI